MANKNLTDDDIKMLASKYNRNKNKNKNRNDNQFDIELNSISRLAKSLLGETRH